MELLNINLPTNQFVPCCLQLRKKKYQTEMEMITVVKSEVSPVRRRLCEMEGELPVAKCGKRRRREPNALALGCTNQADQQKPQQLQAVDQSTTTTTTVKRSSRFRGVSRYGIGHFSSFVFSLWSNDIQIKNCTKNLYKIILTN